MRAHHQWWSVAGEETVVCKMPRHSKDSIIRSWTVVTRQLLLAVTRILSNWTILVLMSLAPGALVGGLGYLLLNDLTSDVWLSAVVSILAAVIASGASLTGLLRLRGEGSFRLE